MNTDHAGKGDLSLTPADLFRAADEGVLSQANAQKLLEWAEANARLDESLEVLPPEHAKGFNLVTIAYYFGAMLMITACAWFLGDKWEELGSHGVLITTSVYFIVAAALGWWLSGRGFVVGGGLLVTVAICLIPLITYSIEDLAGWWPAAAPGEYSDYYPRIRGSWIVIELATIFGAAIALWIVRFGFLTAPLAFSFWFFSMDVAAFILGDDTLNWNGRAWISVIVGLITLAVGYFLDRYLERRSTLKSEDFAFWCYLFGLMAFWGGLTSMNSDSELNKALYALINLGLVGISLKLGRTVFLVFGAIGFHLYIGHLAYRVFEDSVLFPFALAFIGLSLIFVTVFAQRFLKRFSPR